MLLCEVIEMQDEQLYQWAHSRVRQLRFLYLHIAIYVVVVGFLVLINAVTRDQPGNYMFGGHMYHQAGGDWWVIWPALVWGAVVALHGVIVAIGGTGKLDSWEERKAEELMRREKDKTPV